MNCQSAYCAGTAVNHHWLPVLA